MNDLLFFQVFPTVQRRTNKQLKKGGQCPASSSRLTNREAINRDEVSSHSSILPLTLSLPYLPLFLIFFSFLSASSISSLLFLPFHLPSLLTFFPPLSFQHPNHPQKKKDSRTMENNNSRHIIITPPFPLPPNEAWSSHVAQHMFSTTGEVVKTTRFTIAQTGDQDNHHQEDAALVSHHQHKTNPENNQVPKVFRCV